MTRPNETMAGSRGTTGRITLFDAYKPPDTPRPGFPVCDLSGR